jgi:hypothetical protein
MHLSSLSTERFWISPDGDSARILLLEKADSALLEKVLNIILHFRPHVKGTTTLWTSTLSE